VDWNNTSSGTITVDKTHWFTILNIQLGWDKQESITEYLWENILDSNYLEK
jgi:hypothetical protein